jgi:hypothetical protein
VLDLLPGLIPEDIQAIREYVPIAIKSRTHDEITGRAILPKDQLRDGAFYKGRCRNSAIARWNQSENCFYHWREKDGNIFIETIRYPTAEKEPWWDVFNPVSDLPNAPFEIPFVRGFDAEFLGNPDDLTMYDAEMWGKARNKRSVDIEALERMRDEMKRREE